MLNKVENEKSGVTSGPGSSGQMYAQQDEITSL